ncbi:hypothetical protein AN480_09600 [Mycobacterium intracellulare subsp. chimaera]|nr:hypothetical protein AN480_09600 [Mycobacterium intracellulare subsp. chimaera]
MARRDAWYQALDRMAELRPRAVVARDPPLPRRGRASDIDETRRYLDAVGPVPDSTSDATEFYHAVKKLYPDRVNPWAIWLTALRLFSE